jgi:hypothetical protein
MELIEAQKKAAKILDQERSEPTARYSLYALAPVQSSYAFAPETAALKRERPREIFTDGSLRIRIKSINYELLVALLGKLAEPHRPSFISAIRDRIKDPNAFARSSVLQYPFWNPFVSELPLVAEFCLKHERRIFFQIISEAEVSPAILILLLHLEDSIAFSFHSFSEEDLEHLQRSIEKLIERSNEHPNRNHLLSHRWKNGAEFTWDRFWSAWHATCRSLVDECRKGQYLRLKGLLLEGANIEINQDQEAILSFLRSLGFSLNLIASLEQAEGLYRAAGSPFDFKSSMGHLRSFLESLHLDAAKRVAAKTSSSSTAPPPSKWGEAIRFLKGEGVLSQKEEEMIGAFYTLISDKAIHPLIAEREYARLMRNIAIEYGLLFLSNLEKAGYTSP